MADAIADAFVVIRPDLTGFKAQLQREVDAAVRQARASVPIAAGGVGGAAGGGSAASGLLQTEKAAKRAESGLFGASRASNAAKGALIGLSRVTPVTVFGLGLYGTAAIAAGLAIKGAVSSAAAFEKQLNTFQAVTGVSAGQLDKVRAAALALGADTDLAAQSASDAAVALTELAKAGLSVEDALGAARGVLELAGAAEIDAGTAAQIVATQLNAFNLAGTEAVRVVDLLASASIQAQGEIGDFAIAFQQVSAVAHQAGLSIEQQTAALTELARAGLQGADAGTSLRTFLLRLIPTTKQAAEFTKALGITLDNSKTEGEQLSSVIEQYRNALLQLNPVQRTNVLNQIFGQDAIRAASILTSQQTGALDDNIRALSGQGTAAQLNAAKAKGLSGAYAGLKSNVETTGVELGKLVDGPLEKLLRTLSDTVEETHNLVTALGDLSRAKIPVIDLPFNVVVTGGGRLGGIIEKALLFAPTPLAGPLLAKKVLNQFKTQPKFDAVPLDFKQSDKFGLGGFLADVDSQRKKEFDSTFGVAARANKDSTKALRKRVQDAIDKSQGIGAADKGIDLDVTPPQKLQVSLLKAQIADSLQLELQADTTIRDYFQTRLDRVKGRGPRYLKILSALQGADAAVRSVQDQIQSEQEARAAEATAKLKKAEDERKRAAKEAKDAIDKAQADELARFKLGQSELDLAIQAAGLTDTKVDDARAINKKIDRIKKRIALLNKVKKQTTEEKQAVIDLKAEILSLRASLKGLKDDGGGGFSLQDLFKEAVNQLNEFGSNVSTSVTTPGGARGALAGAILAQRPQDKTDVVGRLIARINDEQLSEASKSNDLLAGILEAVGGKAGGRRGGKDTVGPAGFATAAHARKRARVRGN